jgi:hypothetical protein
MTVSFLEYQLEEGYIHNWLVAGPHSIALPDFGREVSEHPKGCEVSEHPKGCMEGQEVERKLQAVRQYHSPEIGFADAPEDRAYFKIGDTELRWIYTRCNEDHLVNVSTTCPTWQYLRYWAYTQVQSPQAQQVTFVLTTLAPSDVWLNGQHIYRHGVFSRRQPQSARFPVSLEQGDNKLMVRFEQVAGGAAACVLALQLVDLPSEEAEKQIKVTVPTCARQPYRHQMFERAFDFAYLEEVVNYRGAHFNIRWADDVDVRCRYAYQIQDAAGAFYVEGTWENDPDEPLDIGHGFRIFERPCWVVLRATGREYFEQDLRYERKMPLYILDNAFSTSAYDALGNRRHEALEDAANRAGLFGEIAKVELKKWADFNPKLVEEIIACVNRCETGSDINLVGLLGLMIRSMDDPAFPEMLKQPLQKCVLNFRYSQDEPGSDAMDFTSESHAILFYTAAILAGQLYPRRKFSGSGKTGHDLREKSEGMALDWLQQRGSRGFQDWNSPTSFEQIILALTHLTSLAKNVTVQELAAVLLDKLFFSLAVNSYKGAFGSTHGWTGADMLKSAQLEASSGISRLLWGMGVFNQHILGTVSLASSEYEFPVMIGDIAADLPKEMLCKERHAVDPVAGLEANTVTYKTPDYMLSSLQDYRRGQPGAGEHIWQATMGSEAVVFVNHPANMSENEALQPGFWRGNQVLPRVAQWKDVLIAVHKLPEDDWMGFTHAYFPTFAFDEYEIQDNWAFARKGDGYLALTASQGIKLNKHQPDGYRELRSFGARNIWLCQMGRKGLDFSFERFKKRVLKMKIEWQSLSVSCKTLRGEQLSFGWDAPLVVNGVDQPLSGFKHVENPYCAADFPAEQMDLSANGTTMRLTFM